MTRLPFARPRHTLRLAALAVALLTACAAARAQSAIWGIYGTINNALTGERLVGARATLMRPDSTVVATDTTQNGRNAYDRDRVFIFLRPPKEGGRYLVRVEADHFETAYYPISVPRFTARRMLHFVGDFKLRRRMEHTLGTATVRATRVKFYHRGDTLVYNADAFNLAEGSMLDALIRQLPGAELKDDGRILVNGKQIETLTLNGEDFFKGNNSVLLENLPAYTVKNIKVYDKGGRLSQFAGRRMGDETYNMDVVLKKEYAIGYLGNAEAGGGSKERWLARAFALRFTPQSRLTLYGNGNNLNDNRKPGENTNWTMDKMPRGLLTTRRAGLDYMVNDRRKRWQLSGNVNTQHTDADNRSTTATENYMTAGSAFAHSASVARSHDVSLATSHEWTFQMGEHAQTTLKPTLNYSRGRSWSDYTAAALAQEPSAWGPRALTDSLRRPSLGALAQWVSNRTLRSSLGESRNLSGGLEAETFFKMPDVLDMVQAAASINFGHADADDYSNRLTDYPRGDAQPADYRRLWQRTHPNRYLNYTARAEYDLILPINMIVSLGYEWQQTFSRNFRDIFRLDSLEGWGLGAEHALGAHPADAALLQTVADTWNSYRYRSNIATHRPTIGVNWEDTGQHEGRSWLVRLAVPVEVQTARLHWLRAEQRGLKRRNAVFPEPTLKLKYEWDEERRGLDLDYALSSSLPELARLIELPSTLDPVNLSTGNNALRNSHRHALTLRYHFNNVAAQRNFSAQLYAQLTDGQTVSSYLYNPQDGSYRFRPVSVDGVKLLSADLNGELPLTRNKQLTLASQTYGQFFAQPTLTGTVGTDDAPQKSKGRSYWVTEDVRLKWSRKGFRAELSGYLSWNRVHTGHAAAARSDVYDYHYGIDVQAPLPWGIVLKTDLKMYGRSGYAVSSLNDDNLVWNLRAQKTIAPIGLTLAVDAFDVLGRLRNVQQVLRPDSHSETRYNATPRYVMGHAIYRFHIKPRHAAAQ